MPLLTLVNSLLSNCCNNPIVVQQCGYIIDANEYVKQLHDIMERLRNRRNDIERRIIEVEQGQQHRRTDEVQVWLNQVQAIDVEVSSIEADYDRRCRCLCGYSINFYLFYKIGRRATYKLINVKALYDKVPDPITQLLPPEPGQEFPGVSQVLATEAANLDKILNYLVEGIRVIGIYGMGGVGKTTLLKKINNRLLEDSHDKMDGENKIIVIHVIWVVVSSAASVELLQKAIADNLKLNLEEHASEASRSNVIMKFLKNKKFVLLLDDVWEFLDLNKVGIPDTRMVIFTTRFEEVCGSMKAQRKHKVETLKKYEAWKLFKENVGEEYINSSLPIIQSIAKQVAERCGGLPLALVVIGKSMSTMKTQEACQSLLTSLVNLNFKATELEKNLYRILKTSYDALPNDIIKQCFLFCSLFPKDYSIAKEELIQCWLGHGLIDLREFNNICEAYDYGHSIIETLKSVCLLEASKDLYGFHEVKMHDVLRDTAFWIACEYGRETKIKWLVRAEVGQSEALEGIRKEMKRVERVSFMESNIKLLFVPYANCPLLLTLILQNCSILDCILPESFECFSTLSYLDLSNTRIIQLPDEIGTLSELGFLDLSRSRIVSICEGLGKLTKLKYLFLRYTNSLRDIPHGVISNLRMLQVLDLFKSRFALREPVKKVKTDILRLQMNVEDVGHLRKHDLIALGATIQTTSTLQRLASLVGPSLWKLDIIKLESTTSLSLGWSLGGATSSLIEMGIEECYDLEELRMDENELSLPRLQKLYLIRLPCMNAIRIGNGGTLRCLRQLCISSCSCLKNINWILQLPCLEILEIASCDKLEQLIGDEDGGNSRDLLLLPSLRYLLLENFRELRSICNRPLDCPYLRIIDIDRCPELKKLPFKFEGSNNRSIQVRCDMEWWASIEWEDESISSIFQAEFWS